MITTAGFSPPGWPVRVLPPGSEDWQRSAVEFLLDCCPVILDRAALPRRQPVVLALLAEGFLDGQLTACGDLLTRVRTSLASQVEPEVVADAVVGLQWMQAHLVRTRREVGLVAGALRGVVYRPRL